MREQVWSTENAESHRWGRRDLGQERSVQDGGMEVREGNNHFSARPVSSILLHPSLPSIYLVMPVEPVGGGPGEGAQVSKQPDASAGRA